MIAENVLENPDPDMFLEIHLWNELPLGQVAVVPGPVMAGCDNFTVKIQGRGGHAALSDQTHDPIMTMVQTISNLQTISSRNVPPTKTAVISVTRIDAGENYNIIPDSVTFYGTIRTFDTIVREHVIARFHKILEQTAELMDCSAQVDVKQMAPPVVNDVDLATRLYHRFQQTLPDLKYLNTFQVMASEDAAFFLERVPGVFLLVGSANSERNLDYPHHHPKFDFDEEALIIGASLVAIAVSDFLGERDS